MVLKRIVCPVKRAPQKNTKCAARTPDPVGVLQLSAGARFPQTLRLEGCEVKETRKRAKNSLKVLKNYFPGLQAAGDQRGINWRHLGPTRAGSRKLTCPRAHGSMADRPWDCSRRIGKTLRRQRSGGEGRCGCEFASERCVDDEE